MPYQQHRTFQSGYHPHYAQYQDTRAHTSHPVAPEPTMPTHYSNGSVRRNDSSVRTAAVQGSHSIEEANRPSLPSISNLLGIADGDRSSQPTQEAGTSSQVERSGSFTSLNSNR